MLLRLQPMEDDRLVAEAQMRVAATRLTRPREVLREVRRVDQRDWLAAIRRDTRHPEAENAVDHGPAGIAEPALLASRVRRQLGEPPRSKSVTYNLGSQLARHREQRPIRHSERREVIDLVGAHGQHMVASQSRAHWVLA